MWDTSHTHTHHTHTYHTINQIGASQSPPLKSLTSSLWPTLWGRASEPTLGYRAGFDTKCNDPRKSASHICAINTRCQTLITHPHTHHTINQIGASQSPPLKSLTSSLRPILWGSVSEPTWGYWASSGTICNDPRKSANHICAIPQKD